MYYTMNKAPCEEPVIKDINHDDEPIILPIWMETMDDMV